MERKPQAPSALERFLGPSQQSAQGCAGPPSGGFAGTCTAVSEDGGARLRRAFATVTACPTSGDSTVLGRWHCHLENADDPEWEARRILRMTARLCNAGYLEHLPSESPQTLSPPAMLSDATSSGSSSDPVTLDGSAQSTGGPEGEDGTDELGLPLTVGPPDVPMPCKSACVCSLRLAERGMGLSKT